MTQSKYVACDFGAGSGRLMLGTIDGRTISLEEVHRFANREVEVFGHFHWNLLHLYAELRQGLARLAETGHRQLTGIAVDTWGVDFGFIGSDGSIIGTPISYRDSRTEGMMERAFASLSRERIYELTGIQFLNLNSLYQLLSLSEAKSPVLDAASDLLFMPDLFNYLLTGERTCEYTIASTSQMLNAQTRNWAPEIFDKLGLPLHLMGEITPTGTVIGPLLDRIRSEAGLERVDIIAPPSHDTASAVVAVPATGEDWAYLSSGTWSLMGIEVPKPIISEESLRFNFTNEGGYGNRIRFLKNSMGLWILERCRLAWSRDGQEYSYSELAQLANEAAPFRSTIDPDDQAFFNPADMPAEIMGYCRRTSQPCPSTIGEFVRCILESLALKYRFILDQINSMRGTRIRVLHVVGGGSQNDLLNQFTAEALGIPVLAGPVEATALGNIVVQAISTGRLADLAEARDLIRKSFELRQYAPTAPDQWEEHYQKVRNSFH